MSASEVREAYRESLTQLTGTHRHIILSLAKLAFDYSKTHAPIIVDVILKRIKEVRMLNLLSSVTGNSCFSSFEQVPNNQMLPLIYLVDAIVKNHEDPYKKLFESAGVLTSFVYIFRSLSDADSRVALYKLRQTWTAVFPESKLRELDVIINRDCDPKWPVTPARANIHINPAVFANSDSEAIRRAKEVEEKRKVEALRLEQERLSMQIEALKRTKEALASNPKVKKVTLSFISKIVSKTVPYLFQASEPTPAVNSSISQVCIQNQVSNKNHHSSLYLVTPNDFCFKRSWCLSSSDTLSFIFCR